GRLRGLRRRARPPDQIQRSTRHRQAASSLRSHPARQGRTAGARQSQPCRHLLRRRSARSGAGLALLPPHPRHAAHAQRDRRYDDAGTQRGPARVLDDLRIEAGEPMSLDASPTRSQEPPQQTPTGQSRPSTGWLEAIIVFAAMTLTAVAVSAVFKDLAWLLPVLVSSG